MKASQQKVLILDSNEVRAGDLCTCLRYLGYEPILPSADSADPAISAGDGIAVVLGDAEQDDSISRQLKEIQAKEPNLPLLSLNDAGQARSSAASDHNWMLDLPLRKSQLLRLLRRAERYKGRERRHRLTGQSSPIRAVRQMIEQVADFDTSVLVTGQSGTGKELVARTIHDLSDRCDKPFVPINCGAIPADLLESELFGHKKGAFTGAISDRTGRFELAEGGTLFLDEIGDMSIDMQVKLLRVLQERAFERVGSNETRECDVRIIAATHRDLPAAVEAGEFRQDLYYRLNVFPIEMPPLYKRVSDLPQLLDELLIQHVNGSAGSLRISPAALQVLAAYPWPGNIRELSNLVERLAILKPEGVIELEDLPAKYLESTDGPPAEPNNVSAALQASEVNLKEHLQGLEQDLISLAVQTSGGVVAQAAKLLNMRRTTLVEKMRKYAIN